MLDRLLRALLHIILNQEKVVASIADLNTKLDALKANVDQLIAKAGQPPVAMQADLDALDAKMDAMNTDVQNALSQS